MSSIICCLLPVITLNNRCIGCLKLREICKLGIIIKDDLRIEKCLAYPLLNFTSLTVKYKYSSEIRLSLDFYCCPIKVNRRKKIRLGYRFDGGRVCFLDFQAPSAEKRGLGRGIGCLAENDFPVLFGVVEQAVEVDIVHQRYPNHGRQSREAPLPFQPFLHQHQQQIC